MLLYAILLELSSIIAYKTSFGFTYPLCCNYYYTTRGSTILNKYLILSSAIFKSYSYF